MEHCSKNTKKKKTDGNHVPICTTIMVVKQYNVILSNNNNQSSDFIALKIKTKNSRKSRIKMAILFISFLKQFWCQNCYYMYFILL